VQNHRKNVRGETRRALVYDHAEPYRARRALVYHRGEPDAACRAPVYHPDDPYRARRAPAYHREDLYLAGRARVYHRGEPYRARRPPVYHRDDPYRAGRAPGYHRAHPRFRRLGTFGYAFFSDFATALLRYDLLLPGPHNYFDGDDIDRKLLASLDRETRREFEESRQPKRIYLDRALHTTEQPRAWRSISMEYLLARRCR
jgi:hypothetical protein